MTLAGFRAWVISKFFSNSTGEIDGDELQAALLEVANQLEAQASWTPILAALSDGARIVVKITDWVGGVGVKPAVNVYWSATGYTANIAQATNIRGAEGAQGAAGTASASSFLRISAANPSSGVLGQISNSQTDTGSSNGTLLEFVKEGFSAWRIGMPSGAVDAFSIRGFLGATFPEYFRINAGGNVGIGTIAPEEKLHVNGNSRTAEQKQLFFKT